MPWKKRALYRYQRGGLNLNLKFWYREWFSRNLGLELPYRRERLGKIVTRCKNYSFMGFNPSSVCSKSIWTQVSRYTSAIRFEIYSRFIQHLFHPFQKIFTDHQIVVPSIHVTVKLDRGIEDAQNSPLGFSALCQFLFNDPKFHFFHPTFFHYGILQRQIGLKVSLFSYSVHFFFRQGKGLTQLIVEFIGSDLFRMLHGRSKSLGESFKHGWQFSVLR